MMPNMILDTLFQSRFTDFSEASDGIIDMRFSLPPVLLFRTSRPKKARAAAAAPRPRTITKGPRRWWRARAAGGVRGSWKKTRTYVPCSKTCGVCVHFWKEREHVVVVASNSKEVKCLPMVHRYLRYCSFFSKKELHFLLPDPSEYEPVKSINTFAAPPKGLKLRSPAMP